MNESMFAVTVGKERIAFNGFSEAKAVLPLTLACQMFAKFAEHVASDSEPDSIHMDFAEQFSSHIGKRYQLEKQRTDMLLTLLGQYYGGRFTKEGLSMNCIAVPGGSTDISVFEKYDMQFYINFELKLKQNKQVNPLLQNATYFLYSKSICSYFITITNAGIRICGALLLPVTGGTQAVVSYLTPLYGHHDTKRIAKAFEGIMKFLPELKLMRSQPIASVLDALPKLDTYDYCDRLSDTKLVFLANRSSDNKQCIVKFVEKYGENVHRYLFRKGLAPELYDILESVRGNWKAIIMELLPGTSLHSLHDTDLDNEKIRKIIDCLRNIKKTLQGSHYVHGDLRPNNLIVTSDFNVVKVVDFDWAGEESKVSYPLNLNTNDIAWAFGVEPCRPITKKHDSWMLDCEIKHLPTILPTAN